MFNLELFFNVFTFLPHFQTSFKVLEENKILKPEGDWD